MAAIQNAKSSIDRSAEALLLRHDDLKGEQRLWLTLWQEVADFEQPRKGNIAFKRSSAQQQTDRLFDSTAPHALELLAASMQGALTSAAFRWFSLALQGVELKDNHELALLLEACSDDMFHAFNDSNFASETHELYLDTPCFGTGGIFVEEREPTRYVPAGALRFTALPPGSFCIDEDAEGYVDTVYRTFMLSARAAAGKFGKDNVGGQVTAALKQNTNQRFEFLHAVYPRKDVPLSSGTRRLPATQKPYGSIWVDIAGRKVMRVSGYDEQCMMMPRWGKTSGEIYGRGPGIVALPDIKTLNLAVQLKLKAWAKAVDPPLMVRDEGVIGDVILRSAGITYVRDMDSIKPLTELAGDLRIADMNEDKVRESIKRMFFSDQLQMQEGPQMTAYEVQVRYELMQRILGPTLGRLTVEYLNPLVSRVFWIRLRASAADSPYRKVLAWCKQNNKAMIVEYEGPLAKAQRLAESTAMQRFWQIALPLTQVDPTVMDNVDLDFMIRRHGDSVGTPAGMMRQPEKVAEIRQARTAAAAQKAQQEAAQQTMKAAGGGTGAAAMVSALSGQKEGTIPGGSPVVTSG